MKGVRILKRGFLCTAGIIAGLAGGMWHGSRAMGEEQAFYTETFGDGKWWTIRQTLPEGEREDGTPVFWYEKGTECVTGTFSGLRELEQGEHYYTYARTGRIPVGKWKVEDSYAYCVSKTARMEETEQKPVSVHPDSCGQPYFSGWMAFCADCGEPVSRENVYMSREAAESTDVMDADKNYYFLCPCPRPANGDEGSVERETEDSVLCGHLDRYWEASPHQCRGISVNRYRVVYDANGDGAEGAMAPSFHMYHNENLYEGKPVTPVETLSLCTYDRTEQGYRFAGWNTRADGTGNFYEDGDKILNLSYTDCNEDEEKGTVTLYAQWEKVRSTLIIDAGEGRYSGENPVTRNWGSFWRGDQGRLVPPAGNTIAFQTNGGNMNFSRMTGTQTFLGWELAEPANGEWKEGLYKFTGKDGSVDTVRAVYGRNPVTLPTPEKEGFFFGGWYFDGGCTRLAGYGGENCLLTEDVTLYAKWSELNMTAIPYNAASGGKGGVNLRWRQIGDKNKAYRIYGRAEDEADFVPLLQEQEVFYSCGKGSGKVGIPSAGFYFLAAEGAQGENYGLCHGGQGGRTEGIFFLRKGEVVEFTVGGQDGYNGGGLAGNFGNGGGCTVVSSNEKGVLMIAGGGGGAALAVNGGQGGERDGDSPGNDIRGEAGMAGGGGGCTPGTAGKRIEHVHSEEAGCYRDGAFNAMSPGLGIVSEEREWRDESDEENNIRSDRYFSRRMGSAQKPIPVQGNTTLDLGVWIQGIGINLLSGKSYVQVMDQNGIPFFKAVLEDLYREWERFEQQVVRPVGNGLYKGWPPIAKVTVHTDWRQSNSDGGEFDYLLSYRTEYPVFYADKTSRFCKVTLDEDYRNPVFFGDYAGEYYPSNSLWNSDILSCRGFKDRPILFSERSLWYGMSGVHFKYLIPIPEGTEGIYIYAEGMMDAVTIHEGEAEEHPVMSCQIRYDSIYLTGGLTVDCEAEDLEIPSGGGGNYVNRKQAMKGISEAGKSKGDGMLLVRTEEAGFTEEDNMSVLNAPDRAAPFPVEKDRVSMTAVGDDRVLVVFDQVDDRGTRYFFRAESFSVLTGEKMYDSNVAECVVTSGVKGYYYLTDGNGGTQLGDLGPKERDGLWFTRDSRMEVSVGRAGYLHIAAVDYAGNIGDTVHISLDGESVEAAWKISVSDSEISSVVNGYDYGSVYSAGDKNTYYIRADGKSPFLLSFRSHMHGPARKDYQIDRQTVEFYTENRWQKYGVVLPCSESISFGEKMDTAEFRQWWEGVGLMADGHYTSAVYMTADRNGRAGDVEFQQAFVMPADCHGTTLTAVPAAGASCRGEVIYSDKDGSGGLVRLMGDGEGPVIKGLEKLEEWRLIDRSCESVELELTAEDMLSGVKTFWLEVRNKDNFQSEKYFPDDDGVIRVSVTEAEAVFTGDFTVFAYAADHVGNCTTESREITEFELRAEVRRILLPHDPVFKRGESGILKIEVWGYAEKAEVEFPEFLAHCSKTFLYENAPQYRKQEQIQFMIPLDAPEDEYEIVVRAYKGDRELEVHPAVRTVEVDGNVLDELRTRLR